MKKNINIILLVLIALFLSSCFTSKEDITKAKQDLGIIEKEEIVEEIVEENIQNEENQDINESDLEKIVDEGSDFDNQEDNSQDNGIVEEKEQKEEAIKVKSLTSKQFLELDDLSGVNLLKREVEITGKTLSNVDKIIVKFQNDSSSFPDDTYQLKQFKSGDDTFLYRAFAKYETLDFGKNTYIFEAHSGDEISELELTLNVILEKEKTLDEVSQNEEIIENQENSDIEKTDFDLSISNLPTKESFGSPISLGNGSFSYSDLKGIEIKKQDFDNISCSNITDNLVNIINGWFFWNTCIEDNDGISYFVIRTSDTKYFYEKHYYNFSKGIYLVLELETGTGIDSKNIGDKNNEFKEKNEDYSTIYIADDLFSQLKK